MVRLAAKLLMWAAALYVFFFVPLGERTLYQHLERIAATPAAQELGGEVGELVESATEAATEVASEAAETEAGDRVLKPARELLGKATQDAP